MRSFFAAAFLFSASLAAASQVRSDAGSGETFVTAGPEHAMPAALEKLGERGLDEIYQMDFLGAQRDFQRLLEDSGGHPLGYFGLSASAWTHLVYGSPVGDEALETDFWKTVDDSILKSSAWIKTHPHDANAYLALGGLYGLRSRLLVSKREWFSAAMDGRRALKAMRQAQKLDPDLYDVYVGIGTWEYYADTLPRFIKPLSRLFLGGDRDLGIQQLRLASEKARYVRVTASLILIEIYLMDHFGAANPEEALRLNQALIVRYPASPLFQQIQQTCFFAAKDYSGLIRSAREYERRIKANQPHYIQDDLPHVFVSLGTMYMAQGNLQSARDEFSKCIPYIGDQDRPNQWALWGLIRLAQIEDAMGDREAAKEHYRQALPYKDFWDYRALVQGYLKKPFQLDPFALRLSPP